MQRTGRRLLITVFFVMVAGGCAVTLALWRLWTGAGDGPTTQGAQGIPVMEGEIIATPTLAAGYGGVTGPAAPIGPTPAAQSSGGNALTGTYEGTISGDGDSTALLRLELVQQGTAVVGTATIGEGLQINAGGFCGTFPVPALRLQADEQLDSPDSRRFSATTDIAVEGFEIPVFLEATLSEDGQTITAAATLETPALCANDPTVSGTLARVGG